MMLHAIYRPGSQSHRSHLVWLHGFLGNHQEWSAISEACHEWPQLLVDLPGHGASASQQVTDFASADARLSATLSHHHIDDYWLVGYSLGGRLAMYHATQSQQASGLRGLVVEGGHPGLGSDAEREARLRHDANWASRFRSEALSHVLADWYQQPVFSDLNEQQRTALISLRSDNNAMALAAMLEAVSLSQQPNLEAALLQLSIPFYYLCGERDTKFRAIAARLGLTPELISGAGHNAHRDTPAAFSAQLLTLLRYSDFKD